MSEASAEGGFEGFDGFEPEDAGDGPDVGSAEDVIDAELEDDVDDEDIQVEDDEPADPGEVEGSGWTDGDGQAVALRPVTDSAHSWGFGAVTAPVTAESDPHPDVKQPKWKPPEGGGGGGGGGRGAGSGKSTSSLNPFRRKPKPGGAGGGRGGGFSLVTVNPTVRIGGGSRTTTVGGVVMAPGKGGRGGSGGRSGGSGGARSMTAGDSPSRLIRRMNKGPRRTSW